MSARVLTRRELNRATLARQFLLERVEMDPEALLGHLIGLQAQEARSWYTGFWSRLAAFEPLEVSRLLEERRIVRTALMRSTIHLVTTDDALRLRPLLQRAVEKPMTGHWRRRLKELHAEEVAAAGRAALAERPLTNAELGTILSGFWSEPAPSDLAMAVRVWVPLVQVPPRGLWNKSGAARHAPLESWVGRPLEPPLQVEDLVIRYLGAFGPATPADAQIWSGLTKLAEVFERLRSDLVTFRAEEDDRELFDLPHAPRPDPDTPAPVRFLYDYDNLMLGHADRTRFLSEALRARLVKEIGMYSYGTLLVDGCVAGIWRIERTRTAATLVIRLVTGVSGTHHGEILAEGTELLSFWDPALEHDIRLSEEA